MREETIRRNGDRALRARVCAFCGKPKGVFAFAFRAVEAAGGNPECRGYAHPSCFMKAKA